MLIVADVVPFPLVDPDVVLGFAYVVGGKFWCKKFLNFILCIIFGWPRVVLRSSSKVVESWFLNCLFKVLRCELLAPSCDLSVSPPVPLLSFPPSRFRLRFRPGSVEKVASLSKDTWEVVRLMPKEPNCGAIEPFDDE